MGGCAPMVSAMGEPAVRGSVECWAHARRFSTSGGGTQQTINIGFTPRAGRACMLAATTTRLAPFSWIAMRPCLVRLCTLFAVALLVLVGGAGARAQENRLPDIGSSAASVLGPAQQAEYGRMLLAQLRHYDYVLEDPLVDGWLQATGNRLGAASDDPSQRFTFFMMKDRSINAFATLGGYIGMNAGLVLAAETEDEVAAVLGHEVAHVTQAHVLRSVERAQRDSIPLLLAMLGAIAIAQSAGGNSSDDAAMAAIAGAQGLAAQRQINYTRSNESEADRIGIRTLARGGYEPAARASMFERMQAASRTNQGGERERLPDYLKPHPVTTTRIGEAKERTERLGRSTIAGTVSTPDATRSQRIPIDGVIVPGGLRVADNPLLPAGLSLAGGLDATGSGDFGWARERLRVLSANTPEAAVREYELIAGARELDDAQRYGLAIAQRPGAARARRRAGGGWQAATILAAPLDRHRGDVWLTVRVAEAEAHASRAAGADRRFEALLERMPRHPAAALSYADVLVARNT